MNCCDISKPDEQTIRCAHISCSNRYHKSCLNLSTDAPTLGSVFWFCESCVIELKNNNVLCNNCTAETPQECTQNTFSLSFDDTKTSDLSPNQDSIQKTVTEVLPPILKDITAPIVESISVLNTVVFELGTQISCITSDCHDLRHKLDSIEAHSKKRNIEITGVPYRSNEKVEEIFVKICSLLDITLGLDHVDRIYRIKPRDNSNTRKSIIVEFKDRSTRDIFIAKAKLSKNLLLINLGFQDSSLRFFVNEHLTQLKKFILYHLKRFKRDIQYERLWVSGGQVYVRLPDRVLNVSSKAVLNGLLNNRS